MSEPTDRPPFKKYVLFAFHDHYPGGGMGDIHGSYETLEEVKAAIKEIGYIDNIEVVDRDTWEEIELERAA